MNTADTTSAYDPQDIAANKFMAVLSYFGLLVLIPWFAAPKSRFARFHVKQGVIVAAASVIYSILSFVLQAVVKVNKTINSGFWGYSYTVRVTPGWLYIILLLICVPITVFAIMGIVNAATGKAKELPLIGKLIPLVEKFIK